VQVEALNDSKLIGISIYNVVVLSILGAIIAATVDDMNVTYGSLCALQLIGTAATLNIVFLPKVRHSPPLPLLLKKEELRFLPSSCRELETLRMRSLLYALVFSHLHLQGSTTAFQDVASRNMSYM
jgi:hypothetical protein